MMAKLKIRLTPLAKSILLRFIFVELAYVFIYWTFYFFLQTAYYQVVYQYDFLYFIARLIEKFNLVGFGIGIIYIFIYYFAKPYLYIDEIIKATSLVANQQQDTEIQLSGDLEMISHELNYIKQTTLRQKYIAKEAEQRKNDLIVYLAHDLKTPLTSVIGYLNLLEDEQEITDQTRLKYTHIAYQKALRLEELINEFFEITRYNLTTLVLDKQMVDLRLMIEQILFEFEPKAKEKEITFIQKMPQPLMIECDVDKFSRVIDNLVKNAMSYCYPKTAIQVTLDHDDQQAIFTISNHGRTIPKEKIDRLFEQFYRLDSSRGSYSGGSGLGLAIAKEIVELHHGSIEAQSENETITFIVKIPLI